MNASQNRRWFLKGLSLCLSIALLLGLASACRKKTNPSSDTSSSTSTKATSTSGTDTTTTGETTKPTIGPDDDGDGIGDTDTIPPVTPVAKPATNVIYPKETNEILHNPGMGWVILEEPLYAGRASVGWSGDFPEADNISLSLSWAHIETADGVYDWSNMDSVIKYWVSKGKKINMRLVTDTNTIGYPLIGVPDWVGDKYGVKYETRMGSDIRSTRVYDIADPTYLRLHDRFVNEFAKHYKNNKNVEVVEIRAYGWWGEWHSGGLFTSVDQRVKTLRHIIDTWTKAWGDKLMVVSASYEYDSKQALNEVIDTNATSMDQFAYWSAFDYSFQKNIAFRRDGLGAALHYWDEKLLTDTFKSNNRLPNLGEHFGGYDVFLTSANGYNLEDLMGEALYKVHVNYMTAIGWVAQEFKRVTASVEDGGSPDIVDLGNTEMGYRLVPHRLEYTTEVKPGGTLNFNQMWSNTAAGRAWTKTPLKVYLTDAKGNEVWSAVDKSFDPVVFVNGDIHAHDSAFTLPTGLKAGTYDLRFAVVDASTGKPSIKLPIGARDTAGRYYVGKVTVKAKAAVQAKGYVAKEDFESGKSTYFTVANGASIATSSLASSGKKAVVSKDGKSSGAFLISTSALKLKANTAYSVKFQYKTNIKEADSKISSDERYWFEARTAKGGAAQTRGKYVWRDVSNETAERTVVVYTGNYTDYRLTWGTTKAYPIAIDAVVVKELGDAVYTSFEEDTRYETGSAEDNYFMASDGPSGKMDAVIGKKNALTGSYGMRLTSTISVGRNAVMQSDPYSVNLKPNTPYIVSFNTQGIGETGPGGYYYLDLVSKSNYSDATTIANWYEREDYGLVNKTYHFVTGSSDDYVLEFGAYRTGVYLVDDIVIVEDTSGTIMVAKGYPEQQRNISREPQASTFPVQENFEAGSYNGTLFFPGPSSEGRMTTAGSEVISGKYSAMGVNFAPGSDEWVNYLNTDYKRLKLKSGSTYSVQFKYRVLEECPNDGYFFFMARKNCTFAADVGYQEWRGKKGEEGVRKVSITIPSEDYYFCWGLRWGGKIAVDDVVITEVKPAAFNGSIDFETADFGQSWCKPGPQAAVFTKDPAKVIGGKYSILGSTVAGKEFNEFLMTDNTKIQLKAGGKYRVSFDYKVIEEPHSGGYFYFFLRSALGGGNDRGEIRFTGKAGETGRAVSEFTLADFNDYTAVWGLRWNGKVTIDNVKIELVA